jgi:hypothetical protein
MKGKVGVLILHGMGQQKKDFAVGLIRRLRKRIPELSNQPDVVKFQPVWWAKLLNQRSDDLWDTMTKDARLDWKRTRTFVLGNLGDAVAYQRLPYKETDIYREAHALIAEELASLESEVEPNAPAVLLAHSLGSYIISNYIWDRQKGYSLAAVEARAPGGAEAGVGPELTDFQKLTTLTGIITYGSNIPVLTLGQKKVEPIDFPRLEELQKRLATFRPGITIDDIRDVALWSNFYDRDDVLGWPLQPLSDLYRTTVTDQQVNAGFFKGPTPLSHVAYQRDRDVLKPMAQLIGDVLSLVAPGIRT